MRVTVREDEECDPLWPNEDYTGEWIIEWPSGALKYTGYYLNGQPHGPIRSYWENGQIAQTEESVEGRSIGLWEDFSEDGHKFKQTFYETSSRFVEKWLERDGSVSSTQVFRDRVEITDASSTPQEGKFRS
jgi:antitoxin component YwqK of YwqJK toxin-antitoxin module